MLSVLNDRRTITSIGSELTVAAYDASIIGLSATKAGCKSAFDRAKPIFLMTADYAKNVAMAGYQWSKEKWSQNQFEEF